jgi:Domain of unknown function (DUF4194)
MTNIFDQMASEEDPIDLTLERRPETRDAPAIVSTDSEEMLCTSPEVKRIVQELLKHGYIEESSRQELFKQIIIHNLAVSIALEPLDLRLRIDSHRGVAFLAVALRQSDAQGTLDIESDEDGWSHPLVRKQRLTLEQSLLVAILRQVFVIHEQESGVGHSPAKVAIDELLPTFRTYFGETGSDSKDETRLLHIIDQLKTHGIVSEVDSKHEVTIRPLVAHLANPESLTDLLSVLKSNLQTPNDNREIE